MPGLNDTVPAGDDYLVRRIKALEDKLNSFMGATTLENSSIGAGGLQVNADGGIIVIDPNTNTGIVYMGTSSNEDSVPQRQMIFEIYRGDATPALIMADLGTAPGHPQLQALQWFDRAGNIVVADDTIGGVGLANPHIPAGQLMDTNSSTWPATTSTSFVAIATMYIEIINPLLTWQINLATSATGSAQFRLMLDSAQVGTTQSLTNALTQWSDQAALPAGKTVGQTYLLELQARMVSGPGSAQGQSLRISGAQS
jgi:hypothetical protein